MQKYKPKGKDSKILGFSKWFNTDGTYEWRACEVKEFDCKLERFHIVFKHNQAEKKVSRINLYFAGEDIDNF